MQSLDLLLKLKYGLNPEILLFGGHSMSQIQVIFGHVKLWIAVATHNFNKLKM